MTRTGVVSLLLVAVIALAAPLTVVASGAAPAERDHHTAYFTGRLTPSLELFSFNLNLNAFIKNEKKGAPPISTVDAIKWAASAGFKAVDITAYYLPGYNTFTMPTVPRDQVMAYADQLKALCKQLGLAISGTGAFNDFADPNAARRALDVQRVEFWTDVAAEMGAPVMRVFSGQVPPDIDQLGWETITKTRIVPALREVTEYAAGKGVKIVLQNHGDMTATAAQTIQMVRWVDDPNLRVIDDTGYFRPFLAKTGLGYNWYPDIARVLPFSASTQVKKEPAGEGTGIPMDLNRLFTDFRLTSYRGFIPLELLWVPGEPGYPRDLPAPPFDQISAFKTKVDAAIAQTRTQPYDGIAAALRGLSRSGDVRGELRERLADAIQRADGQFTGGHPDKAMAGLHDFLDAVAQGSSSEISDQARQTLTQQGTALLQSMTDVFPQ